MGYSKKGWDVVSDIIRELGSDAGLLCGIETDIFHLDIANIMDYMCKGKTFKGAVRAYRDECDDNASWLEEFLDRLGLTLSEL